MTARKKTSKHVSAMNKSSRRLGSRWDETIR